MTQKGIKFEVFEARKKVKMKYMYNNKYNFFHNIII